MLNVYINIIEMRIWALTLFLSVRPRVLSKSRYYSVCKCWRNIALCYDINKILSILYSISFLSVYKCHPPSIYTYIYIGCKKNCAVLAEIIGMRDCRLNDLDITVRSMLYDIVWLWAHSLLVFRWLKIGRSEDSLL